MAYDSVTLEDALRLLALPRELGPHPETGEIIVANNGRFGPYVQHQRDFRSLKKDDNVHTVTLERALEIFATPKQGRGASTKNVLRELGESNGAKVQLLEGKYGAYVSDGATNATIPRGTEPETVTLAQALDWIAEKAKSGGGKKKAPARKAAAKSEKRATRKPAAKKATKKASKRASKKE
jgi:DNA topoisomerase-1